MKSKIFAALAALLLLGLAGCDGEKFKAVQQQNVQLTKDNIALTRANESLLKEKRERQAIADAGAVCRKDAIVADFRHVSACNSLPLSLAMTDGFKEFRAQMQSACKKSCRETTLAMASDRLLRARAAEKGPVAKLKVPARKERK